MENRCECDRTDLSMDHVPNTILDSEQKAENHLLLDYQIVDVSGFDANR
jgi:hypothetical protein